MAEVKFLENVVHTNGPLPLKGTIAPDFSGVKNDLSELSLYSLKGQTVVLNVFPSLDTPVCAASVRRFNKEAANLPGTTVLALSKDLPFAQSRFCTTEGIENVIPLSLFRDSGFEEKYGTLLTDGPLKGVFARAVIVVGKTGEILYSEFVPEITNEPDYEAILKAINN
ncbi:putative thiol peroxidase [Bacteroidia bacterium]|nr:putative thiol peroxidase [Bacteroidia bacterium]